MENFIGKWYKKCEGETLNVIKLNEGFKLKMSFESSGHFNFEPNCFYMEDEMLCYEINDEAYRRIYKVKNAGNRLVGTYTQNGRMEKIVYEKISDIPEDLEYCYKPLVPGTDKTRMEVLREYSEYSEDGSGQPGKNQFALYEEVPEVLYRYEYRKYVQGFEGKLCDELVFSLLDFVCDHFAHNGCSGMPTGRKVEDIIDFLQQHDNKINCRGLAMLLANLLRFNGIRAVHVTCEPYEEPFDDCHVVVDCLLPSGHRVMLDPTNRLFLRDRRGDYVSLPRLREMLCNEEELIPCEKASYNRQSGFNMDEYRTYMTKNTFRFSKCLRHYDGCEEGAKDGRVELVPVGYSPQGFQKFEKNGITQDAVRFWEL